MHGYHRPVTKNLVQGKNWSGGTKIGHSLLKTVHLHVLDSPLLARRDHFGKQKQPMGTIFGNQNWSGGPLLGRTDFHVTGPRDCGLPSQSPSGFNTVKTWPHSQAVPASSFDHLQYVKAVVSKPDPLTKEKSAGKSAWVEMYTAPGMQVHFRLAFD